jgi:superfamily I DNA and/or RNA helicase
MAEFLLQGKTVLFVSNTNRAVDVGLLSVIQQLETLDGVYRLGETALEDGRLVDCQFEAVVEQTRERMREQISAMQGLISRYDAIRDVDVDAPDPVTVKMKELGGKRKVDADLTKLIDRFASIDYSLLNKSRLMATTLAKVCTSELLDGREFDVVVLDEASMASLPYVLVIAAKAASHMVIAGDPMQLPPISQSDKPEAKTWMETDMYASASGAKTTSDLFAWHDANPDFTCFFDTQYRMPDGLAALISDVFYEGRLITPAKPKKAKSSPIQVIDSSPLGPSIVGKQTNGFQPVNEVHQGVVRDLVVQLVLKHSYSPYDIGIIVPFRSAVWDLRQVLRKDGFNDVEVGTVHTFQGREKKVIIFDTVMSGMGERGEVRHFSVRPFDEAKSGLQVPRLLNVAFSRAKEKVFLIADLDHMRKVYPRKFLGKLLGRIIKGTP